MKIDFKYDREKDVWCLLNKGKSSINSNFPTRIYTQLVSKVGDSPTPEDTSKFIDTYLSENSIDINKLIESYQSDWDSISDEFYKRAEAIWGVSLPHDLTVYLTVNNRCPYNIKENNFFVTIQDKSVRTIAMHELWHFYTWYGLGTDEEEKIGKEKYNMYKESLSVLLNVEFKNLFLEGSSDRGYPQHKEIRDKILEYWAKDRDIKNLWSYLTK